MSVECDSESRFLTTKDAARYLGISERTLWSYVKSQLVRVIRFGKACRYDPRDLDAFVESRKSGGSDNGQHIDGQ
jgi:excisionase family DNA binding protein